jgi:hypothetical protein
MARGRVGRPPCLLDTDGDLRLLPNVGDQPSSNRSTARMLCHHRLRRPNARDEVNYWLLVADFFL